MDIAVSAHSLTKSFGRREVLHGVDFEVQAGQCFGVIGPNGAGKTTTMRCLLDIIRPTGGEVRVLGQDPRAGGPDLRRRIGYLPGRALPGRQGDRAEAAVPLRGDQRTCAAGPD